MEKRAFSQYVPAFHASTEREACIDEVKREIDTRKRLYDRWVAEGKCTWQEAHDRMTRLMGAHQYLMQCTNKDSAIELETAKQPF